MAFNAGNAFITISPDMSSFNDEVKAQFAEKGDESGKAFGDAFQDQLKASFADLPDATIKADVDTAAATAELDELAKPRTATIRVSTNKSDLDQVKSDLAKVQESASKLVPSAASAAAFGGVALGPQAVGAAVGAAGIGVSLVAAAADAGAFGAIAVPMFSAVTKAQAALTTAQAAYNKATTDKGRATALAAEKAALDGLTPSEQQLATQLTALTSGWKKFSDAQQPVVEGALTPWLQTAASSMGLLAPLVQDGANAIQLLGVDAQQALQSPFWATFTSTLGQTGEDALTAFGTAAGSVGDGLAHLFVTFAPDIDKLLDDVPTLAGDFDTWAKGIKAGGLEDFFSKTFSHANLSTLDGDLKDVGDFFKNVSSATETLSPAAFSGLSGILTAIGLLPPDAILALTALFLATKTIGAIGNIAGLAGSVISLGKSAAGLLTSGAATTAETTAEGTEAGTAGGAAAGKAFTTAFGEGVTAGLAGVFGTIEGEGTIEATAAGTSWGGEAAGGFSAALGGGDALGLTAVFSGITLEGTPLATGAGTALGGEFAGGFLGGVGEVGGSLLASMGIEGGALVLLGAALAGGALGLAVGGGFVGGLALSGAAGAVGKLGDDAKNAVSSAGTWLTPAGQDTVKGYITGFDSQQAAATAAAGQLKGWVTAPNAGSNAWLSPTGTQAAQGFQVSFAGAHAAVNSTVAQLKTWILEALPSNSIISLLTPLGASAAQGFANGIISMGSTVLNAALSLANSVKNAIADALDSHSPSRETFKLGAFGGQGFGLGLASQVPFVGQQAGQLAMTSMQSLAGIASAQSLGALSALGVPSIGAAPRLPGVSSPLSAGQLQLGVTYTGPTGDAVAAIVQGLQYHIQGVNGGDAQGALGQGPVRLPS